MTLVPSRFAVSVAAACLIAAQPAPAGAQVSGEALYAKRCAMCHDKDVPRAPRRETLRLMSPEAILGSLQGGTMVPQAAGLTLAEKRAVAVYAAGKDFGAGGAGAGRCSAGAPAFTLDGPEWAGWGAGPENARFQPKPGLSPADLSRLKVRWAFGFPGIDPRVRRSAVAGGRVLRRQRRWRILCAGRAHGMHPLELHRGSVGARGAERRPIEGWPHGGVLRRPGRAALRARRGAWHAALADVVDDQIAAVITGAPKLHDGRLYVPISVVEDILTPDPKYPCCRSRGALAAVDAETGKILWKAHSVVDPPQKSRDEQRGHRSMGSLGREHLELPHHRRGEGRRLRRHRQQSLEPAHRLERRRSWRSRWRPESCCGSSSSRRVAMPGTSPAA